jgi:metacaspase-1
LARLKAVLVGIEEYERSDIPSLRGCVNDVVLVRSLLKDCFGVPNEDIRVVLNQRATQAGILHRMRTMVEAAEPGDLLVFYYSGHGSQIRDRDGDELTDLLDELICPYDMDWDRGTYILDDDLDVIFDGLPEGVLLEAFFDCCFWGASPRALDLQAATQHLRPDVRYLPPPLDIAARFEGDESLAIHRFTGCSCFHDRNVLWGASQEGRIAAEDVFEGRVHGVFTYYGCRFIEANVERVAGLNYSREQLLEDVRAYLNIGGYVQVPELSAPAELRADQPFLPGAWVERGYRRG